MINIAKLLKDVPKGWKLYSPLFGEVNFVGIDKQSDYPINVTDCKGNGKSFTEFGVYFADHPDAECLLFPSKDCRTWEEWKVPVKPKFKVGDWVVCWNRTCQIIDNKSTYIVREINGLETRYEHSTVDENGHLWSIADAKDGDVLATDNGWTCIFKAFDEYGFSSYCFMDSQKWFCEVGAEGHTLDSRINGNIHPATKEQRELLFKKMKEAGYQWDTDKKELKKIK